MTTRWGRIGEGEDSPYFFTNRSRTVGPTRRLNSPFKSRSGKTKGVARTHSEPMRGPVRPRQFDHYGQRQTIQTFVSIATG